MPSPVLRALSYLLLAAAVGAVVGLATRAWIGWAIFSAGLIAQLVYHLLHFVRLERWSRQPSVTVELEGAGAWDEVFARLYRHERMLQADIDKARRDATHFVAAVQALIDGLVSIDPADHIDWLNRSAEEILGLDRRTDIGKSLANLVRHPEFIAFLKRGDYSRAFSLRAPHDPQRALSVRVVPYDEDRRRLMQVRDVTQAERIDQMRRDFVANVSHELRTPLTVLSGFVETLRDLDLDADERSHYLGLMAEQSNRMERLLQELLMLSNLESAPPPAEERVALSDLLAKLCRDAEALSGGQHSIVCDVEGNWDLLGSESEITSALSNLVSNAVRYTPAGGSVTLRWRVEGGAGEFSVTDTGIGIDAKHLPRLTERFYRVDKSRSRETGGTGLGLAIVKHALSRHQAALVVDSTPGKGSVFTARFPASRLTLASEAAARI